MPATQKTATEKVIMAKINPDLHRELKILSATEGLLMQEFVADALVEKLARYKKERRRQTA